MNGKYWSCVAFSLYSEGIGERMGNREEEWDMMSLTNSRFVFRPGSALFLVSLITNYLVRYSSQHSDTILYSQYDCFTNSAAYPALSELVLWLFSGVHGTYTPN